MHCAARAAQEVVLALMTSPFLLSDGGDAVQVSKGAEPPRAPIDRHASNRVQNKRRELMRSQQSFMSITSSGKGTGSVRSGRSRNVVQPVQTTPVEDPRWVELFAAADAAKKGALTLGALQSFLCYHGHHQLAAGSILKGVLQELGVGLTEPIRLPQFAKYMAWALKRYPTLEFGAYSVPPERYPTLEFGAYPLPPEDDAEQQQAAEAEELLGILRAQQAQQRSSVKPASAGRGRVGRVLQSPRQRSALAGSMSAPAFGGGGAGGSENIGGSGTERLQQQRALAALVQPAVNVIEPLGPETSLPPQPAPSRRPSTAGAAVGRAAPLPGSTGGGGGSSTGGARRNRLHTAVSRQSSKGGAARRQLLMQKFVVPDPVAQPSIADAANASAGLVVGAGVTFRESVARRVVATRAGGSPPSVPGRMSRRSYRAMVLAEMAEAGRIGGGGCALPPLLPLLEEAPAPAAAAPSVRPSIVSAPTARHLLFSLSLPPMDDDEAVPTPQQQQQQQQQGPTPRQQLTPRQDVTPRQLPPPRQQQLVYQEQSLFPTLVDTSDAPLPTDGCGSAAGGGRRSGCGVR
ncbi:hypothetical protein JKP88DRAFT_331793 [Tribonema minus]|uniref:Uncharacterized protein n=1 Tax=Tribonema minus TaxID=303371 RepID=A0A835YW02_9STRA|nr:hypothetical protein JKP88DRAFT_331793 [Tribonema minus]